MELQDPILWITKIISDIIYSKTISKEPTYIIDGNTKSNYFWRWWQNWVEPRPGHQRLDWSTRQNPFCLRNVEIMSPFSSNVIEMQFWPKFAIISTFDYIFCPINNNQWIISKPVDFLKTGKKKQLVTSRQKRNIVLPSPQQSQPAGCPGTA